MTPFVHLGVDVERRLASRVLGDDDLGAALVQFLDDPVHIEGLVGNERTEFDVADQRFDADRVMALTRQKDEADKLAECIDEREDLGCPAAPRFAYSLILGPPFAPCP